MDTNTITEGTKIEGTKRETGGTGGEARGQNVGPLGRWLSGLGGAALLGSGLRSRSVGGLVAASVGVALVYRAMTGRCAVYRRLGIDTSSDRSRGQASDQATGNRATAERTREDVSQWRRREPSREGMAGAADTSAGLTDAPERTGRLPGVMEGVPGSMEGVTGREDEGGQQEHEPGHLQRGELVGGEGIPGAAGQLASEPAAGAAGLKRDSDVQKRARDEARR